MTVVCGIILAVGVGQSVELLLKEPVGLPYDAVTAMEEIEYPVLGTDVELNDAKNAPNEPEAAVESGKGLDPVPIGALVLKAIGILLAGAVPVGRNAVEFALVLEIEPFRGPSGAEKFPVAGRDDRPVPIGAVTRGAEGPVVPNGSVVLKGTPVLNGTEAIVSGAVPRSDEFTVGIDPVPDKVILPVGTEGEADTEVRDLKWPLLSPN